MNDVDTQKGKGKILIEGGEAVGSYIFLLASLTLVSTIDNAPAALYA